MTLAADAPRLLLCATTTGYQTRMFDEAAARLGVDLVLATDRCDRLDDPWRDRAIAVRFHDERAAVDAVGDALAGRRLDGVLAVGDRPAVLAALVAESYGLPWHSAAGARAGRDKRLFRERQRAAGLPAPWTATVDVGQVSPPEGVSYPCVVKPLVLSGSRGVIRADDPAQLRQAMARVAGILQSADVRVLRDPAASQMLIEGYVDGHEFAIEGLMDRGAFHALAVFDKPDPLVGPYFEETIYVTPTSRTMADGAAAVAAVAQAARAAGLHHGPVHAECRVTPRGVIVLEAAARPIGGLCARAIGLDAAGGGTFPLEHHLLVHALGGGPPPPRVGGAAGVMMVPIPSAGILREVGGVDAAREVPHVTEVTISANIGQVLLTIPDAASYLGFIFAEGADDGVVVAALRAAHSRLRCDIAPTIAVRHAPA
jgi:hypothetical protein